MFIASGKFLWRNIFWKGTYVSIPSTAIFINISPCTLVNVKRIAQLFKYIIGRIGFVDRWHNIESTGISTWVSRNKLVNFPGKYSSIWDELPFLAVIEVYVDRTGILCDEIFWISK